MKDGLSNELKELEIEAEESNGDSAIDSANGNTVVLSGDEEFAAQDGKTEEDYICYEYHSSLDSEKNEVSSRGCINASPKGSGQVRVQPEVIDIDQGDADENGISPVSSVVVSPQMQLDNTSSPSKRSTKKTTLFGINSNFKNKALNSRGNHLDSEVV